jgi:hypothetical protein
LKPLRNNWIMQANFLKVRDRYRKINQIHFPGVQSFGVVERLVSFIPVSEV